jgi:phosphoglycerate dehydrogenase-like enzyme
MCVLHEAGCQLVVPPKFGPHRGKELAELLAGVDAVLATVDRFDADVFGDSAARALKIISRWGVGFDSVDIPAATAAGVIVAYTPSLLSETVADFGFAMILALARRVHEAHRDIHQGYWQQCWGSNVHGKVLGLVGCGRIGQMMARRALGFNMTLLAYDPRPQPEAEGLGVSFVSLDELLARSDFVSLHAALTPTSRGLIGEAQLRRMKSTAYLINSARGALVDEPALVRALQEGWIAGAALDTFAAEPLATDHPLRRVANVLLTPHQASFTRETGENVSLTAAQAIVEAMNGRRPKFVVNPEVFSSATLRLKLD